ncbi:hypothetical protein R1sor_013771 [Riccia sorocarpa]|uniref:Uncharacterized protein n=1 Tax=Riccia sorocarpa TaxID=122646 RepID=A0ABD3HAG1_9MARC
MAGSRYHPSWAKDKRKRWTLALGRIRLLLLMEVREDDKRKEEVNDGPEQRVEATRRRIEQDQSMEAREEFEREVHKFYQELNTAEEETPEVLEKRKIVIRRIDRKLTPGDNTIMEEVPTDELITRIVMDMPKEKSPGLDGVEILRIGWEFMKEDCFQMVQGFWDKKKLVGKDNRGVIKLIPKNDATSHKPRLLVVDNPWKHVF